MQPLCILVLYGCTIWLITKTFKNRVIQMVQHSNSNLVKLSAGVLHTNVTQCSVLKQRLETTQDRKACEKRKVIGTTGPSEKWKMCPCSTKTREVLENPSPRPERYPETQGISRGRSRREILRVEGNPEGGGDGFPNTSHFFGGVRTFSSSSIHLQGWIRKSIPVDREGLTVLKSTLPCWGWENDKCWLILIDSD